MKQLVEDDEVEIDEKDLALVMKQLTEVTYSNSHKAYKDAKLL